MNSKTLLPAVSFIETTVSVGHLKDHIISFLHAGGFLQHGEEVKSLTFGKTNRIDEFLSSDKQTLPMTIEIQRKKGG